MKRWSGRMAERTWTSYETAEAFRDALEARLSHDARQQGVPVNRLRKEAVFHRLLARFVALDPQAWALKGGFALIARLGRHVRATRDVDANWRENVDGLEELLAAVEALDLEDWFRFEFGDPQEMEGEVPGLMALRYPVTSFLGAREFERVHLDVNFISHDDPRPVERTVVRRNPFSFVGADMLTVPMITPSHQLAEKLHAYLREYPGGRSSRPKDLYDSLLIIEGVQLPAASDVASAARETFAVRGTAWPPPVLSAPPDGWQPEWEALVADSDEPVLGAAELNEAFRRWCAFWNPVLSAEVLDEAMWSPSTWSWETPPGR